MGRSIFRSWLLAGCLALGFLAGARGGEPGDYSSTFKVDALAALGQVLAIDPRGALAGPEGDELRLLQDVRAGNVKKWNATDVALVVAGVSAEDRPQYKEQLDQITAEAYEVTKDEPTP